MRFYLCILGSESCDKLIFLVLSQKVKIVVLFEDNEEESSANWD